MSYPSLSHYIAGVVTFARGHVFPSREPEDFRQVVGVSEGGQVRIWTMADPEQFLVRTFEDMPQADRDAYYDFIHDANINGRANTFTFTDTDGTAYTVRWWQDDLGLQQDAYQLWSWTATFRVEVP